MDPIKATEDVWRDRPDVIRDFLKQRPHFEKLCDEIAFILERALTVEKIEYSAVTWRTKTLESYCEKVLRKSYANPLQEITDLAGVRVVYLYPSDRKKVESLIENQFIVVEKIDRVAEGGTEHFGYGAVHYLVKLGKAMSGARYDDLKDLLCEIQVRTILQDAWAIVAHHLSYKRESDVPNELRRKLNALSGLFETADDQFDKLRSGIMQYAEKIETAMASHDASLVKENLNLDNLVAFLKLRFPDREQPGREQIATLLAELQGLGYKNLAEVNDEIKRSEEAFKAYEKRYPPFVAGTSEYGPYNAIGAVRASLRFVNKRFREQFSPGLIKEIEEFLSLVKPKG